MLVAVDLETTEKSWLLADVVDDAGVRDWNCAGLLSKLEVRLTRSSKQLQAHPECEHITGRKRHMGESQTGRIRPQAETCTRIRKSPCTSEVLCASAPLRLTLAKDAAHEQVR
jgi:hypothetical protein